MIRKLFLASLYASLLALVVVSCDEGRDVIEEPEFLYVTIGDQTKVQMDAALHTYWNEGDVVSVFRGTSSNDCWAFTGSTGETTGVLVKRTEGSTSFDAKQTVILYPYLEENSLSPEGVLSTSVDGFQLYEPDSYGVGANRMVASGTGDTFTLKNLCGYVELCFTGSGSIESITLTGNDGEAISGAASADVKTLALEVDGSGKSIVLDCGTGVQLSSSKAESFIFALAPQTFAKGISAVVKYVGGKEETKTTDASIDVDRNVVVTLTGAQEVTSLTVSAFENPEQGDVYYW